MTPGTVSQDRGVDATRTRRRGQAERAMRLQPTRSGIYFGPMERVTAPTLVVRFNGVERSFPPQASPVTFGRSPDCTLPIDLPMISRHHAAVVWRGTWLVEDNRSANGVFVDGHRLTGPLPVDRPFAIRLGDPTAAPPIELRVFVEQRTDVIAPTPRPQPRPVPPAPSGPPPQAPPPAPTGATSRVPPSPPTGATSRVPPSPPKHSHRPVEPPAPPPQSFTSTAFYPRGGGKPVRHDIPRADSAEVLAPAATIPVAGETIGRTPENSLVIEDMLVSRRHARLRPVPDGLLIEDLNSVNGTFVNGVRVIRTLLHEGDIVTFGNHDFVATEERSFRASGRPRTTVWHWRRWASPSTAAPRNCWSASRCRPNLAR